MHNKKPDFVVRSEEPFNGGPPVREMVRSHITPTDLFFSRNHGNVPDVDADAYRLEIMGKVSKPMSFSLDEIKSRFARVSIPATLQCAGNRREEMIALRPIPSELPWGTDAISHAVWAGVRLGDVLADCGLKNEANSRLHVDFLGLDETERLGKRFQYGGSIPLTKALKDEVILAYEMNGETLTPAHGAPLRVVVPGYIGARSIKWLERIAVQDEPSQNYFQRRAYRLFSPQTNRDNVNWDEGMMLGELSVTSVICSHEDGARISAGPVTVEGYAMAGGDRQVTRVDVSSDGGRTWTQAGLSDKAGMWSWQLWKAALNLEPGEHQWVARAVDSSANSQPQDISQVWNFKGYMNNAWHRVNVIVS
jgi:sulfite oxidase